MFIHKIAQSSMFFFRRLFDERTNEEKEREKVNLPRRQVFHHFFGQDAKIVAASDKALQDDVSQWYVNGDIAQVIVDALEALLHHFNGNNAALFERLQ